MMPPPTTMTSQVFTYAIVKDLRRRAEFSAVKGFCPSRLRKNPDFTPVLKGRGFEP
jgi:hypothetical protein